MIRLLIFKIILQKLVAFVKEYFPEILEKTQQIGKLNFIVIIIYNIH